MAASCSSGPCVNVYTDPITHQIVITAHQYSPGSASDSPKPVSTPKPQPTRTLTPKPKPKPKPKPTPKSTPRAPYAIKATPTHIYRRPVKRAAPRASKVPLASKVATTAINLSDQINKLLPGNHLFYQPVSDPLSGVPVYFWSDAGNIFKIATSILSVAVNVTLNPTFDWDFGDGSTFSTTDTGGPYPNKSVVHTYSTPGNYTVTLTISWIGSWAAQGVIAPVLGGAIVQTITSQVNVSPAPTNYTR